MSQIREIRQRQVELAGLRSLLDSAPEDPFSKPLLSSRVAELEREITEIEKNPVATPETEIYFSGGVAVGSIALDAKFAAQVLDSYPDIITNQYAAIYHGNISRTGRRRGESASKLYLTALPRGSFGLQLAQPFREDFYAAQNMADVMEGIAVLIASAADSDEAFDSCVDGFHPRVLKPLQRFLETVMHGKCGCRILSGKQEVDLTHEQVVAAQQRVATAEEEEQEESIPGIFGGNLLQSRTFELTPNAGQLITGFLSEDVTDEQAQQWAMQTGHEVWARVLITRVTTRSGRKKPRYELLDLEPPPPLFATGALPTSSRGE